ncbi:hypothetical protein llap_8794 [Limosa lapponica baueri]|uniref:Secreted protein n=1 Tax=Limosa lapponica baueri TaxID=1758121 RepID=A0A2I0U4H2_LIMLA|nr:hypothetical protein llap_8794 [Limosa lapponica baueri]
MRNPCGSCTFVDVLGSLGSSWLAATLSPCCCFGARRGESRAGFAGLQGASSALRDASESPCLCLPLEWISIYFRLRFWQRKIRSYFGTSCFADETAFILKPKLVPTLQCCKSTNEGRQK